mgnify:CR=1 FL=1
MPRRHPTLATFASVRLFNSATSTRTERSTLTLTRATSPTPAPRIFQGVGADALALGDDAPDAPQQMYEHKFLHGVLMLGAALDEGFQAEVAAAVAEMAAAGVTATESSAPERSLVNQIGWDSKPVDHVHSRPTRDIASAFFCSDRFCSNALILRSFGHRSV